MDHSLAIALDRKELLVKIYLQIARVIRLISSSLQLNTPRTLSGVCNQVNVAARMLHNLTGEDGHP